MPLVGVGTSSRPLSRRVCPRYALLSEPEGSAGREEKKAEMATELKALDQALRDGGGKYIGGGDAPCEVDCSLGPKLWHTLVCLETLAGLDMFAECGSDLEALAAYMRMVEASEAWQRTNYTKSVTQKFWGDYLIYAGKMESYEPPTDAVEASRQWKGVGGEAQTWEGRAGRHTEVELFAMARPHCGNGVDVERGACRYCQWVCLWLEAKGIDYVVTFIGSF